MKNALAMLVKLAEIDKEIDALQNEKQEIPKKIKKQKETLSILEAEQEALTQKLENLTVQKREGEEFVAEKKSWIVHRETQLKEIKTNKEFNAAQKEISMAKKEISDRETLLLGLIENSDQLIKKMEELKTKNEPQIAEINKLVIEEEAKLGIFDPQIDEKTKTRQSLIVEINEKALKEYELTRAKISPAVAKAENCTCTECGSRMQPQTFNQLFVCQTLHHCKRCKRILFVAA